MADRGVTISQAGLALGVSYNTVLRLVLTHALAGWQDARGRWWVAEKSLRRYQQEHEPQPTPV